MSFQKIFINARFLVFVFLFLNNAHATDECVRILGKLDKKKIERTSPAYLTIPIKLEGVHDQLVEIHKTPVEGGGFIHTFRVNYTGQGAVAQFDVFKERILLLPLWAKKLGFHYDQENAQISIPDLAALNSKILDMLKSEDVDAPSVIAGTYFYQGQISNPNMVKLWSQRRFIVSTNVKGEYWFTHDFLNHGLHGYLFLPREVVVASYLRAKFLISVYENPQLRSNKALKKFIKDEIDALAQALDRTTENIQDSIFLMSEPHYKNGGLKEITDRIANDLYLLGQVPPASFSVGQWESILNLATNIPQKKILAKLILEASKMTTLSREKSVVLAMELIQKVQRHK
jgi:hypothetical protein